MTATTALSSKRKRDLKWRHVRCPSASADFSWLRFTASAESSSAGLSHRTRNRPGRSHALVVKSVEDVLALATGRVDDLAGERHDGLEHRGLRLVLYEGCEQIAVARHLRFGPLHVRR